MRITTHALLCAGFLCVSAGVFMPACAEAQVPKNRFYLFGMVGGSVLEFGPDSARGRVRAVREGFGGSVLDFGGGYARTLYRALFASLEASVGLNTSEFRGETRDDIPLSGIFSLDPNLIIRGKQFVQFGLNAQLGWRFARAQVSFFAGPHWAQIETEAVRTGDANSTKRSVWQGYRLGGGLLYPLSEHWALRSEYRFARVRGRTHGATDTLDYHDLMLGLQYDF